MELVLKVVIAVFLLSGLYSSASFANTLECNKSEGIKSCQIQAQEFCGDNSFNIKSAKDVFKISCDETQENQDTNEVTNSSQPMWRFALGLGYNFTGKAESDLKVTNLSSLVTSSGTVEYDVEPGANLNFEARYMAPHNWGFTVGVDLDMDREIKTGSVTVGSETVTFTDNSSNPDSLSAVILYGNLVYQWEEFYIPFGFNISVIDYESTGLNVNSNGTLGAQLGIGYVINNSFAFELFSRAIGFELDYISSNLNVRFEEGIMTDIAFRAKYIF